MIILLLFNLAQAIDLTTLHLDANYLQNHTAQFKTQLQLDQQTQTKPAINTMPEDQFSDQTRMNQILYEQEERAVQKTIKIHDTPPPSPYRPKYEEIPDEQKPQTNAKLPRKKLQEEAILGEPILDVLSIAPIAQRHKVALLVTLIFVLCVLILMREMYFKSLHRIFREYLWKISLETTYCMFVIVVFIALYYNNYFDFWLLNYQYQQEKSKEDILLIEIKDYEENYKYNIYAYLLIGGLVIISNYLIHFLQIFVFDKQMQIWSNQENKWLNKYQLVQLYKQQKNELNQKKEQQQQFNSKEIEQEIIEIQDVLLKTEECMDYLLIKLQFTSQMSPYLGPNVLDSSFNLSNYLGYISADVIYQISVWDTQQYIIFTIYFLFMIVLLYLINIIIVSMLYCLILFIKIINLNYTLIMIKEKCLIKKEYDNLLEDELQVVPPFMEPIFENILPKRSVDIQTDLFPFANKRYISIVISSLTKLSTTLLFVMNIYFYYWQPYAYYVVIICNVVCIATCISIIYISNNIIHHYTIVLSLYIRNYDFAYNVIKQQKQLLIEASNHFYELLRYINKKSLQHTLQKNHLLLLRPVMVDIIDLCKKYQKKGMQQAQYDPREVELVDLGIEGIDLIHKKHLKTIIYALTDKFSEQDLVYIESFCSDDNAEYFSPMKLILYLHLRYQEVKMNSRQLIKEVLEKVIPMTFDVPQKLEAEIPDNYIQDGLQGYLDINVLDNFLKESVKSNFYKDEYRVILIQQLTKLKSKKLDSISNFISDQISQLPQ
ncbi:unnamed protein product [Paramecium octaurelia]|uniref:Transmembrane protein n=1 Tax=Paramecium octaurelia TaxID=43137 RepID=A0A8S1XFC0_PAROT|nr:unnamed protein product [Paramecium octaurelia]